MKKIIFICVAAPAVLWAHGSPIDATAGAAVEVLKLFKGSESAETRKNFAGVTAWPDADKIFAKVYVGQGNARVTVNYSCVMNHADGHDAIVCQKN